MLYRLIHRLAPVAALIAGVGCFALILFALTVALPVEGIAQLKPEPPKKAESPPPAPKPANIDRNGVLILIRSVLFALDHANRTGNYTVLRDLGAPAFQANSAARLAEIFANHRRDGLDLSGLAVIEPQLTVLPQIRPDGMMRMAGFFPSAPMQVNFDLVFAPVDRQWRLFGISVNLSKSGPQAPQASATKPAEQQRNLPPPIPPSAEVKIQRPPAPR